MRLPLAIFILVLIKPVKNDNPLVIPAKWNTFCEKESKGSMSMTNFRFNVDENNLVARVVMSYNVRLENNPLLVVFRKRRTILSLHNTIAVNDLRGKLFKQAGDKKAEGKKDFRANLKIVMKAVMDSIANVDKKKGPF